MRIHYKIIKEAYLNYWLDNHRVNKIPINLKNKKMNKTSSIQIYLFNKLN